MGKMVKSDMEIYGRRCFSWLKRCQNFGSMCVGSISQQYVVAKNFALCPQKNFPTKYFVLKNFKKK